MEENYYKLPAYRKIYAVRAVAGVLGDCAHFGHLYAVVLHVLSVAHNKPLVSVPAHYAHIVLIYAAVYIRKQLLITAYHIKEQSRKQRAALDCKACR